MTARLLDLTRTLRRVGRVATGVDRVERAYLQRFLAEDVPCFALCRTALGYVLLDRDGMRRFSDSLEGRREWMDVDLLSRLPGRRDAALQRAESTLRHLAHARALPQGLRRMLAQALPAGVDYYNIGHSNLTERVLRSVGAAQGKVHVMLHDVIPLELPEMQRPGTLRPFREMVQRVGRMADRVIYPSEDSRGKAEGWMRGHGRCPPGVVAPLGVEPAAPDPAALPEGLPPERPYFLAVGTIEPRKNHAFLLDLWQDLGPDAPPLLICGSRGWNNAAVFARLDALPPDGPVREVADLTDGALSALMAGAAGLLAPSAAEGFGLPPLEALRLGCRVMSSDIPVFRENLAGQAEIFPVSEREKWLTTIREWGQDPSRAGNIRDLDGLRWEDHFKIVLRLT